jgi:hypothetical protein
MAAVKAELDRTARLQKEIWTVAMAGQKEVGQTVVTGLLPVLNEMFDIVTTRTMTAKTHPPSIVFYMLALMACAARHSQFMRSPLACRSTSLIPQAPSSLPTRRAPSERS